MKTKKQETANIYDIVDNEFFLKRYYYTNDLVNKAFNDSNEYFTKEQMYAAMLVEIKRLFCPNSRDKQGKALGLILHPLMEHGALFLNRIMIAEQELAFLSEKVAQDLGSRSIKSILESNNALQGIENAYAKYENTLKKIQNSNPAFKDVNDSRMLKIVRNALSHNSEERRTIERQNNELYFNINIKDKIKSVEVNIPLSIEELTCLGVIYATTCSFLEPINTGLLQVDDSLLYIENNILTSYNSKDVINSCLKNYSYLKRCCTCNNPHNFNLFSYDDFISQNYEWSRILQNYINQEVKFLCNNPNRSLSEDIFQRNYATLNQEVVQSFITQKIPIEQLCFPTEVDELTRNRLFLSNFTALCRHFFTSKTAEELGNQINETLNIENEEFKESNNYYIERIRNSLVHGKYYVDALTGTFYFFDKEKKFLNKKEMDAEKQKIKKYVEINLTATSPDIAKQIIKNVNQVTKINKEQIVATLKFADLCRIMEISSNLQTSSKEDYSIVENILFDEYSKFEERKEQKQVMESIIKQKENKTNTPNTPFGDK